MKQVLALVLLSPASAFLPMKRTFGLTTVIRAGVVDERMNDAGIVLPPPGLPKANYNLVSQDGDLLYLSGHLPAKDGAGDLIKGKLVPEADSNDEVGLVVSQGYEAARWCGLNLVASLKESLDGDLDRVEKIVKVFGIVASADNFHEQHLVVNGCSDVLGEVFGKEVGGQHARSAIGTNALPLGVAVEIECIARIKPKS